MKIGVLHWTRALFFIRLSQKLRNVLFLQSPKCYCKETEENDTESLHRMTYFELLLVGFLASKQRARAGIVVVWIHALTLTAARIWKSYPYWSRKTREEVRSKSSHCKLVSPISVRWKRYQRKISSNCYKHKFWGILREKKIF